MEVRNRKNQKSGKSDKSPDKEKNTLSNDYDWDFGSIAKNKLAKIQELDPGKFCNFFTPAHWLILKRPPEYLV